MVGKAVNALSYVAPSVAGSVALNIFSKPRSGWPNDKQNEYLDTAEKFTLEGESGKIQGYHWDNSGPLVLLMHGWESNAGRWQPLHKYLSEAGFSIISFDAPAHGHSEGESFNAKVYGDNAGLIFQKYKVDHAVGHSIGAGSLLYAVHHFQPESLKSLALLAPPIGVKAAYDRYSELMAYRPALWPLFCTAIYKKYSVKAESFDGRIFGRDVSQPCLILHDPEDSVIPYSESEAIAAVIENAELKAIDGLGHRLQHTRVYKEVLGFFQEGKEALLSD
jgi:pimeloyl-ACP methyl ester carboxylesterase